MNANHEQLVGFGEFHHIGIAVANFKKSLKHYQNLGYIPSFPSETRDELQKVELYMLHHDIFPDVELVKPYDDQSPIHGYLKDNSSVMYHWCFEVDSFDHAETALKKTNRTFCVAPPKPAILFNHRRVTFYNVPGVGLFEFLEKEKS